MQDFYLECLSVELGSCLVNIACVNHNLLMFLQWLQREWQEELQGKVTVPKSQLVQVCVFAILKLLFFGFSSLITVGFQSS